MANCSNCIFPLLRGCFVGGFVNNAACLTLYKDRRTCKKKDCDTCKYLKACKEKGINLNKENQ